jgi:NAD kinase
MKEYLVLSVEECDMIVVWWWDGWMLQSMRKFSDSNKSLVWVNCGTLGFMLNTRDESVWKGLQHEDLTLLEIPKVSVEVTGSNGSKSSWFFYNDCVLGNHIVDYMTFSWTCNQGKSHTAKGTGLAVTSMLGSTGYALNLWQPLIPVDADLWWIVGIATAPFSYQYTAPQELIIECSGRGTIMCGLDGRAQLIDNIASIRLLPTSEYIQVWFLPWNHFATKRVLLAQEKMGGM